MNFNKNTAHGIKWTSVCALVSNILGIVQISMLARILEKSDFGLMAIVSVVIGFSDIFIDIGVSNAIIYKDEISKKKLDTLYWINIIVGILFFAALCMIAGPLSVYYQSNELKPLLVLIAATFLIKPWGQQHMVLMQKNLQFDKLAIIEMLARLVAFCFTILAAYLGMRVYSLAIGMIILSLVSSVGYIIKSDVERMPLSYFNLKEVKDEVRYGLYQLGEKILNYCSYQFDTILIGRLLGLDVLGLYNISNSLAGKVFNLINPIAIKVTYPVMARLKKDKEQLNNYHLLKLKFISYITFPLYTFFFVMAVPVVYVLLGKQWTNASSIFSALSFSYIILTISNPNGTLLLSVGKVKETFYWNFYSVIVYPLSILIGSTYGLFGIIYALVIMRFINYFVSIHYLVKPASGLTVISTMSVFLKPALFSLCCALITYVSVYYITSFMVSLIVGGVVYFLLFVSLVYVFDRATANEILQLVGFS